LGPARATSATCTRGVASNLTDPTGNCLTSYAALERALTTSTNAMASANATFTGGNPIYGALGKPATQVVVPGATTLAELTNLNANLYIPFSVQPGLPGS